ncbi:MAG: efflux RND transporter permease subunit [Salibacter sp.]|uniref:efflux RND transporter permease subunit n=1 Tax=Salibacter sp. TaxID=2010995 RepID=UPI00286FBB60|nr:efflux RND transporter permease subunit [Salibacter sp.]MDR9398704.1 efflux RND transporter permease subunit [Salibacter sp.]
MLNKFIERPVLSTVISIVIVILGVLGINTLPVTQYPDIAPPTVQVRANYPGANAETILESVISPIEEQINGVEGMMYMTSKASNNGSAEIQVFFEQGYDPDIAAVNVQNRVARANAVLPSEVIRTGVITQKRQNSALMYAAMFSTSEEYNDTYVQNYLKINVVPELQRINGVGEVNLFGGKEYSMRIWLDPTKMANYNLTPADVNRAIQEQSREAAPGSLGQNAGESFEYVIKYKGRLKEAKQYEDIIIRANNDGSYLRLKDVAEVELDAFSYTSVSRAGEYPSISFGIFQTPGSNAQEINNKVLNKLDELKKDFPEGLDYQINYNTNKFLDASIDKVAETLIEAFLLVFLVVFIFLQDFRSTLIPAIAVPVSIVGTFFFLQLFGFSMNLLTLFALILAIGIVVDDAIVVVEAVHAKMERGAENALEASKSAMSEISGAIISITLVMAAVFVPITFIQGPAGVFYQQFGLTLIIAILISALNALTLSPALCAIFLKANHNNAQNRNLLQRFYSSFNVAFEATTQRYGRAVKNLLKYRWITAVVLVLAGVLIWWSSSVTPSGFVPSEDRGVVFMNMELPPGTSMDRTFAATQEMYDEIEQIEGVRTATTIAGRNFFSGNGSSYGMGFILLENWENRDNEKESIEAITGQLFKRSKKIKDADIIFFTPPSIPGFGSSDGFQVELLDKSAGELKQMNDVAEEFIGKLREREEIAFASNSFSTEFPQYELSVDAALAKRAGVSIDDILNTLQGYYGGIYSTDFSKFGKPYKVYLQSLPEDRANKDALKQVFVRNGNGEMAPISSFVELKKIYGPQTINRFNLFNSVSIKGSSAPGYSSGDAIKAVEEVAESLPINFDVAFSGITREEIKSQGQAPIIIGLSILFVFFFLAAQYESYLLPFSVLFSLPVGVAGAYFTTYIAGLENNIYFQIALVMLLGLLAKNAILIVEFARQRRQQGMSLAQSAIDGAKVRLRPILMTSFAFILGLLPLVLANGVGAAGNNSIGTGAAGGMLIGTIVGLFIIPVFYVIFQWLHEKVSLKK